jgi:predicted TIM-barrel fold metal-dependent hydrolase
VNPFDPHTLLADLEITLDIDVLFGHRPSQDPPPRGPDGTPSSVLRTLAAHRIAAGAVAHLRAALFDPVSGNDAVLAAASGSAGVVPVGAVDLRDPIGSLGEVERLAAAGVRVIRFFPEEQGAEADFPSVREMARRGAALGLTLLTGGDVRGFWRPFSGIGARVVFLDTHFYHLGDFLLAARDEPDFHTSTRLLNSPDALETVAGELGADRLLFGSRTPECEPLVPLLRLATSGLTADQRTAVAGGNARRLLCGKDES